MPQAAVSTIRAKGRQLELNEERLKAAAATEDRMHVRFLEAVVCGYSMCEMCAETAAAAAAEVIMMQQDVVRRQKQ